MGKEEKLERFLENLKPYAIYKFIKNDKLEIGYITNIIHKNKNFSRINPLRAYINIYIKYKNFDGVEKEMIGDIDRISLLTNDDIHFYIYQLGDKLYCNYYVEWKNKRYDLDFDIEVKDQSTKNLIDESLNIISKEFMIRRQKDFKGIGKTTYLLKKILSEKNTKEKIIIVFKLIDIMKNGIYIFIDILKYNNINFIQNSENQFIINNKLYMLLPLSQADRSIRDSNASFFYDHSCVLNVSFFYDHSCVLIDESGDEINQNISLGF